MYMSLGALLPVFGALLVYFTPPLLYHLTLSMYTMKSSGKELTLLVKNGGRLTFFVWSAKSFGSNLFLELINKTLDLHQPCQ